MKDLRHWEPKTAMETWADYVYDHSSDITDLYIETLLEAPACYIDCVIYDTGEIKMYERVSNQEYPIMDDGDCLLIWTYDPADASFYRTHPESDMCDAPKDDEGNIIDTDCQEYRYFIENIFDAASESVTGGYVYAARKKDLEGSWDYDNMPM